jgi:predicted DNA-binding transcriptional regulator AlpA
MTAETSSLAPDDQMPGCDLGTTRSAMPSPAFFRLRDVLRITSLSRPTLYRRIAARRFPAPVHLGGRACGWASAALQSWINDPAGYGAPSGGEDSTCRKRGRPRKSG